MTRTRCRVDLVLRRLPVDSRLLVESVMLWLTCTHCCYFLLHSLPPQSKNTRDMAAIPHLWYIIVRKTKSHQLFPHFLPVKTIHMMLFVEVTHTGTVCNRMQRFDIKLIRKIAHTVW